jgi:hypothetical protein
MLLAFVLFGDGFVLLCREMPVVDFDGVAVAIHQLKGTRLPEIQEARPTGISDRETAFSLFFMVLDALIPTLNHLTWTKLKYSHWTLQIHESPIDIVPALQSPETGRRTRLNQLTIKTQKYSGGWFNQS